MKNIIESALQAGKIKEREAKVLLLRSTLTLKAIGKEMGVTPERIRQIEAKGNVKLRRFIRLLGTNY
jgi:DNA-directed RNA polymerase sigma subunit (sigma70/sigma32)